MHRFCASLFISAVRRSCWASSYSVQICMSMALYFGSRNTFTSLNEALLRATDNLFFSASETGLPFLYARFAPDEEVTVFSVCDISPPQYLNRDRFAENTTVFWNQRLESCDDDLCWRTNHVWLRPFNVILIIKWLKSRKCFNQGTGPGRDRQFLAFRVSAPEIPHTSGKRGLPSPPGSLLPCFRPELPAPLYFPCEYSVHITVPWISVKNTTPWRTRQATR